MMEYTEKKTNQNVIEEAVTGMERLCTSNYNSSSEDLMLRPELILAANESGFKHPSEVQQECIPRAIKGMDILCQSSAGTGKTAIYVLATLQQLQPVDGKVTTIVLCPTRELTVQIDEQYKLFSKHISDVKINTFFGGLPVSRDVQILTSNCPDIVIGTPGRVLQLIKTKKLNAKYIRHFIIDECDKMLQQLPMRRTVQEIFTATPRDKQVMMLSSTIPKDMRIVCKRFMKDPYEHYMNDVAQMSLQGLQHFYASFQHATKTRDFIGFLSNWRFDQAAIFVSNSKRCDVLAHILTKLDFFATSIHKGLDQNERLSRYKQFTGGSKRILVATNLFGRGMDVRRINLVINYDIPENSENYLHRATRAGRFGAEGKILSLVASEKDAQMLSIMQDELDVEIGKVDLFPSQLNNTAMNDTGADRTKPKSTPVANNENADRPNFIRWAEEAMNSLCDGFEQANLSN